MTNILIEKKNNIVFVTGFKYTCPSPILIHAISLKCYSDNGEWSVYTDDPMNSNPNNIIYALEECKKYASSNLPAITFPYDILLELIPKADNGRFWSTFNKRADQYCISKFKMDEKQINPALIYSKYNDISHHDGLFFIPISSSLPDKMTFEFTLYSIIPRLATVQDVLNYSNLKENDLFIPRIKDVIDNLNEDFNELFIEVGTYKTTYNPFNNVGNVEWEEGNNVYKQVYRSDWELNTEFDFELNGKCLVANLNDNNIANLTYDSQLVLEYNKDARQYVNANKGRIKDYQLYIYPMWIASHNFTKTCPYFCKDNKSENINKFVALTSAEQKMIPFVLLPKTGTMATSSKIRNTIHERLEKLCKKIENKVSSVHKYSAKELLLMGVYNNNLGCLGGVSNGNDDLANFIEGKANGFLKWGPTDKTKFEPILSSPYTRTPSYPSNLTSIRYDGNFPGQEAALLPKELTAGAVPWCTVNFFGGFSPHLWNGTDHSLTAYLSFLFTLVSKLPNAAALYKLENKDESERLFHGATLPEYKPVIDRHNINYVYDHPLELRVYNTAKQNPVLWAFASYTDSKQRLSFYGLLGYPSILDDSAHFWFSPSSHSAKSAEGYINSYSAFSLPSKCAIPKILGFHNGNIEEVSNLVSINHTLDKNKTKADITAKIQLEFDANAQALTNAIVSVGLIGISTAIVVIYNAAVTVAEALGFVGLYTVSVQTVGWIVTCICAVLIACMNAAIYGPPDNYFGIAYPNVRLVITKDSLHYPNYDHKLIKWLFQIKDDGGYNTKGRCYKTTNPFIVYEGGSPKNYLISTDIDDNVKFLNPALGKYCVNDYTTSLHAASRSYYKPSLSLNRYEIVNTNPISSLDPGYYIFKINCTRLANSNYGHNIKITAQDMNGNDVNIQLSNNDYDDFYFNVPNKLMNVLFSYGLGLFVNLYNSNINFKNIFFTNMLFYVGSFGLYKITDDHTDNLLVENTQYILPSINNWYEFIILPSCINFYDNGVCYDMNYNMPYLPKRSFYNQLAYYNYDELHNLKIDSTVFIGHPKFLDMLESIKDLLCNLIVKEDSYE